MEKILANKFIARIKERYNNLPIEGSAWLVGSRTILYIRTRPTLDPLHCFFSLRIWGQGFDVTGWQAEDFMVLENKLERIIQLQLELGLLK